MQRFVPAHPYAWPYHGALRADNTALIVIDMQTDRSEEHTSELQSH